jgi:hypothetical protein
MLKNVTRNGLSAIDRRQLQISVEDPSVHAARGPDKTKHFVGERTVRQNYFSTPSDESDHRVAFIKEGVKCWNVLCAKCSAYSQFHLVTYNTDKIQNINSKNYSNRAISLKMMIADDTETTVGRSAYLPPCIALSAYCFAIIPSSIIIIVSYY